MAAESSAQRAILDWLQLRGIFAWRQNTGGVPLHGQPGKFRPAPMRGVSDILAILPPHGRLLAIEVKGPKGRVAPDQRRFLDAVSRSGGIAVVARGVADVERIIKQRQRGQPGAAASPPPSP